MLESEVYVSAAAVSDAVHALAPLGMNTLCCSGFRIGLSIRLHTVCVCVFHVCPWVTPGVTTTIRNVRAPYLQSEKPLRRQAGVVACDNDFPRTRRLLESLASLPALACAVLPSGRLDHQGETKNMLESSFCQAADGITRVRRKTCWRVLYQFVVTPPVLGLALVLLLHMCTSG